MKKFLLFIFLLPMILCGCNLPFDKTPALQANAGIIQTWIDAPLDGDQLPLAPYEIVFHANDPLGVKTVELLVNNQPIPLKNEQDGKPMQEIRTVWVPAGPGEYTISAYTLDASGKRDEGSQVKVVILGQPTTQVPTPTPEISSTDLTPSLTPTVTPTISLTSTPSSLLAGLSVTPHEIVYGNCATNQVQFMVQVHDVENITAMFLFVRLRDPNSNKQTGWNSGFAMNATTQNGIFVYTLPSSAVPEAETFSAAYLEYQFVATNAAGEVIGRSPTFGDVSITKCGIIQPIFTLPPFFTLIPPVYTPTPTPQIVK